MAIADLKKRLEVKRRLAMAKAARELALVIPEILRLRTRQEGQGVDGVLQGLRDKTIEYRRGYQRNLHPDTTPDRSNLTATGQLLDSIKGRNIGSRVIIEPGKARRKGELSGGKSRLTNREVRKFVEDNGRVFLELSPEERKEAIALAEEIIKEELRSAIK